MQLADLKRQMEEVNAAVEAGEETRRKMQRELENATQRERAKEEEKDRVERQKERLREEIEDMTIALQRERQNCTALEKRQKKFDQVGRRWKRWMNKLQDTSLKNGNLFIIYSPTCHSILYDFRVCGTQYRYNTGPH